MASKGSNLALCLPLQEFPAFFSTIEDFLWFKLRLVRVDERAPAAAVGAGGQHYGIYMPVGNRHASCCLHHAIVFALC